MTQRSTLQRRIDEIVLDGAVLDIYTGEDVLGFLVEKMSLIPGGVVWGEPLFSPDPFFDEFQFHFVEYTEATDDGEEITFAIRNHGLGAKEMRLVPIELSPRFGGDELEKMKPAIRKFHEDLAGGQLPGWERLFQRAQDMAKADIRIDAE